MISFPRLDSQIRSDYQGDLVRLSSAVLCVNCEIISEPHDGRCRACGSESVLGLAGILGEIQSRDPGRKQRAINIGRTQSNA